jgi:hypothetical protein
MFLSTMLTWFVCAGVFRRKLRARMNKFSKTQTAEGHDTRLRYTRHCCSIEVTETSPGLLKRTHSPWNANCYGPKDGKRWGCLHCNTAFGSKTQNRSDSWEENAACVLPKTCGGHSSSSSSPLMPVLFLWKTYASERPS